jgi:hypothetical protein
MKVKTVPDENGTTCFQVFKRTWYGFWKPVSKHKFFYVKLANLHMKEQQEASKNARNYILLITATTTVVFTFLMAVVAKLMGY